MNPHLLKHTVVNSPPLTRWQPGFWRIRLSGSRRLFAGITDRSTSLHGVRDAMPWARGIIEAQQVHGASLAAIGVTAAPVTPVAGCDGLATAQSDVILTIRTADCLPILAWDPVQDVIGVVHAGWRGLTQQLPIRLVAFLRQQYGSQPRHLRMAIGPSIRACCYDVGSEFVARFDRHVRRVAGAWRCDLIGSAIDQLVQAGVSASRIVDCGVCTACDPSRWYSFRRDGNNDGRLFSFIVLKSSNPTR